MRFIDTRVLLIIATTRDNDGIYGTAVAAAKLRPRDDFLRLPVQIKVKFHRCSRVMANSLEHFPLSRIRFFLEIS